ncbi:MAG: DUF2892 domain-containing protein [Pseudomonadota bacterium]
MLVKRMMTTRNVGAADRLLRVLPALIVAGLWLFGDLGGAAALALGVPAAMLLATALTGSCSVYYLLGVSTRGKADGRGEAR